MLTPTSLSTGLALTDEEVVARVVAGERELFEILMRRHNRRVFRAARSLVTSDAEAEDVMQEAYLRAFEALPRFEGRAKLTTWLTRITINVALTRRRGAPGAALAGLEEAQGMTDENEPSPEQRAFNHQLRLVLERAVEALPEHFRTVFVLRAVEQLSVHEVAEALDLTEETVKTRFFRAKAQLKDVLAEHADPVLPSIYEFHLTRCDRVVEAVLKRISSSDL